MQAKLCEYYCPGCQTYYWGLEFVGDHFDRTHCPVCGYASPHRCRHTGFAYHCEDIRKGNAPKPKRVVGLVPDDARDCYEGCDKTQVVYVRIIKEQTEGDKHGN